MSSTTENAQMLVIIIIIAFFLSLVEQKDEVYLNLLLDYVPETVYRVIRHHYKAKQIMPMLFIKVQYSLFD